MRGGTETQPASSPAIEISIHPPCAGRDIWITMQHTKKINFNPPALCGAGPRRQQRQQQRHPISIHPPCAGRDDDVRDPFLSGQISIHPPCAGRDIAAAVSDQIPFYFNPPALCGAGPSAGTPARRPARFQSTRPVRGGTGCRSRPRRCPRNFNPPALCGAGLALGLPALRGGFISIHPPCAGRDSTPASAVSRLAYFNPPALCGAGPIAMSPA